jgi:hypothetical protein
MLIAEERKEEFMQKVVANNFQKLDRFKDAKELDCKKYERLDGQRKCFEK